jgi:hypothetical protein
MARIVASPRLAADVLLEIIFWTRLTKEYFVPGSINKKFRDFAIF